MLHDNQLQQVVAVKQNFVAGGTQCSLRMFRSLVVQVPPLGRFLALRQLELSYNQIRSLAPLSVLASRGLRELYAASNKLGSIQVLVHTQGGHHTIKYVRADFHAPQPPHTPSISTKF